MACWNLRNGSARARQMRMGQGTPPTAAPARWHPRQLGMAWELNPRLKPADPSTTAASQHKLKQNAGRVGVPAAAEERGGAGMVSRSVRCAGCRGRPSVLRQVPPSAATALVGVATMLKDATNEPGGRVGHHPPL